MPLKDPERLVQAESPLATAIRAARQEHASASDVARLGERLERTLATLQPEAPRPRVLRLKTVAGAVFGSALLFGALQQLSSHPAGSAPTTPPQAEPSEQAPAQKPAMAAAAREPIVAEQIVDKPTAPSVDTAARPRASRTQHKPVSSRHAPPQALKPATPESELKLLQEAQAALASDAERALALCETHLRSYPRGIFCEEREMLAIEALQKLRRKSVAVTRARQFVQQFPDSTHVRRLRPWLDATVLAP